MKAHETVETLVIDLMVRGAVDQDAIRRSLRELRFQLADEGLDETLEELNQALGSGDDEREYVLEDVVRVLDSIHKKVTGSHAAEKAASQIENALNFDRAIGASVLQSFGEEFRQAADAANDILRKLSDGQENAQSLKNLFGALHTGKGVSSLISAEQMTELAHKAESVISRCVSRGQMFQQERFLVQDAVDLLGEMAVRISDAESGQIPRVPETHGLLIERLDKLVHTSDAQLQKQEAAETTSAPVQAQQPKKAAETEEATTSSYNPNWSWEAPSEEELAEYESVDAFLEAVGTAEQEDEDEGPGLDALVTSRRTGPPAAVTGQSDAETVSSAAKQAQDKSDTSVRVSNRKLEALIDLLGELVIAETQVVDSPIVQDSDDLELQRQITHLKRITLELQNRGLALRMFPMKDALDLAAQTARKAASTLGKRVEVKTYGDTLEVEKSLIDTLSEPLVHLMRNAVGHGIEDGDTRAKNGKGKIGTVAVACWQSGDRVFVEVSDDGGGINVEKVFEKAMEQGLIADDADLTNDEIVDLIFHSGLSTTDEVDDISGRGVGMDVVRQNIRAIGGDIQVRFEKGNWSAFTVSLPARLAVMDGLLISENGYRYIIPTQSVARTLRPESENLSRIQEKGEMLRLPEAVVPIVRFNEYVGVPSTSALTDSACLVIRSERGPFGLVVDEIVGQKQFVVKPVHDVGGSIQGVLGGVVQGDGSMALVLDVDAVGSNLLNNEQGILS